MQPEPASPAEPRSPRERRRIVAFAAFCLITAGAAAAYVRTAARRSALGAAPASGSAAAVVASGSAAPLASVLPPPTLAELRAHPHLYVRSTREGELGRIAIASLDRPDERLLLELGCERAHFGKTRGVCMKDNRDQVHPPALALFTEELVTRAAERALAGFPSRARISPDERLAATTVFVTGDSYGGDFSTRTTLFALPAGDPLGDLEQFAASRDGRPFRSVDFNYWGVTFAKDANRFYATLGTKGQTYLVEGNVKARRVKVLRAGVECPSLSPNEKRLAFKHRTGPGYVWRIAVLELQTLADRVLPGESRNIDDQVEWLDDDHVLYGISEERGRPSEAMNVWVSPVDGDGAPRIFAHAAVSPAVVGRR
jgi:hypothetical protein